MIPEPGDPVAEGLCPKCKRWVLLDAKNRLTPHAMNWYSPREGIMVVVSCVGEKPQEPS